MRFSAPTQVTAWALMACLLLCMGTTCEAAVIRIFSLTNHPDGNIAPPTYGLRLDGVLTGDISDRTTFSFDESGDVELTVTDATMDGGGITIEITGTVFGGVVDTANDVYMNPMQYTIDFTYEANVIDSGGGWKVTGIDNTSNIGTLTKVGSNDPDDLFTIVDDDNNSFLFKPDGHRLSGDSSTWVGRGWLTTNLNGNNVSGTQDWLFVGQEIPEPGTLALLGLGATMLIRRRKN